MPVQIDVGVGDAVTPAPETASFPRCSDFPAPPVRTYPVYTVVAEKFEAMAKLPELYGSKLVAALDRQQENQSSEVPGAIG